MAYRIFVILLALNGFIIQARAEPLAELDELQQGLRGDSRDKSFFFGATDSDLENSRCYKAQHRVPGNPDINPQVTQAFAETMILYCQELAMIFSVPLFDFRENDDFCSANVLSQKLKTLHMKAETFLQNPDQRVIGSGLKLLLILQMIGKKRSEACNRFGQAL
jgi:hypothetical protein